MIQRGTYAPSPEELGRLQRLHDVRREITALRTEESALKQELQSIPNGFRMSLPDSKVLVIRNRERVMPKLSDITLVSGEFLKESIDVPAVRRHFVRTGNEPDGITIQLAPGALTLR